MTAVLEMFTQRVKLADVLSTEQAASLVAEYEELKGRDPTTIEIVRKGFVSEKRPEQFDLEKGERAVVHYISTEAKDRDNEILRADGADLSWYSKNPVVMWGHDYSGLPVGKNVWVKKDTHGLLAKTLFANHAFAEDVWQLYRDGFMRAWSVGFMPLKDHAPETSEFEGADTVRRVYDKWVVLEYSAVPVPANPEALSIAVAKGLPLAGKLLKDLGIKTTPRTIDARLLLHTHYCQPEPSKRIKVLRNVTPSPPMVVLPIAKAQLARMIAGEVKRAMAQSRKNWLENQILLARGRVIEVKSRQ